MDLPKEDHVFRHVPFQRTIRDDNDKIIGLLPTAFELRPKDKGCLSVNWIEFFNGSTESRIDKAVNSFRESREKKGSRVGTNSAFGIANVGKIENMCATCLFPKVRIVHSGNTDNPSHSKIIRLPNNDERLKELLASQAFSEFVLNADIPQTPPPLTLTPPLPLLQS